MLRLLKKEEILKAQSSDKAKEIAEGLKISRRVDSLRELQANEEQSLAKWRNESLSAIQEEINALISERDGVRAEILSIKEELSKETTLTREERLHLEDLKKTLEIKEKEIDTKSKDLDLKEIDIAIALKDSADALARAKTHEETTFHLHEEAERKESEASQSLNRAKSMEDNALRFKKESEESIQQKENILASREKLNLQREEKNLGISRELAADRIRLADREKTLERSLERIRLNRLA